LLTVPLTFFSIRLFRTIHPVVIATGGGNGSAFNMTPRMLTALVRQPVRVYHPVCRPGLASLPAGTIYSNDLDAGGDRKMPANTLNDMILGYAVILGILLIYVIIALIIRTRIAKARRKTRLISS
jgi:hypothetical protein